MEPNLQRVPAVAIVLVVATASVLSLVAVDAQYMPRPEDPLGLSIREPRVRVIHSKTTDVPGTSMHLLRWDPWLAYQRGRSYFLREWSRADGVFSGLPDRPEAATGNSCGMCHNLPFPSAGSGNNVAIEVGVGRTAQHLFGAGLLETVGLQVTAQILAANDLNGNGYLDVPDEVQGRRAVVEAAPGVTVDFGSLEDEDDDGFPDLNPAILVRMVDSDGERRMWGPKGRSRLTDPDVVGYDLAVGTFSSSSGDHQFPSMRTFSVGVFTTIMGIQLEEEAEAVTTPRGRTGHLLRSWKKPTITGAPQAEVFLNAAPSFDVDDPDRPTMTVGELDLLDWYLLNHPAPALARQTDRTRRGARVLSDLGCTSCHVRTWRILPEDEETGLPGDRRFFHLDVEHSEASNRLEGTLHDLTERVERPDGETLRAPRRDGFTVENVFTDLRHHDLGERFWEYFYKEGRMFVTKHFRTPPLWGVGSTAPYGHDGRSLTLDDVIRRHGGEAEASVEAYVEASPEDRDALIAFLRSLVLYQPESLPTDLDGDGEIAKHFRVAGRDLGPETFRPEFLFRNTPRYRGWVEQEDGARYYSYALTNLAEAYGMHLEALEDENGNTVPDLLEDEGERSERRARGAGAKEPGAAGPGR